MDQYGPEERELFETQARALYEHVLTTGPLGEDHPRIVEGGPDHEAFLLLTELGLLVFEAATDCFVATDPSAAQARVVTPLGLQGAELLQESSQWAEAFNSLSQTWRRAPHPALGSITELRAEAINPFLTSLVRDAESELLTAQPQAGRAAALETALQRDIAALERGVQMRTLYQHSARRNSQTHRYVAAVTARGSEVRTLDEFFNRLIVVDRRVAVIPGHEGLYVALAIRDPSLVAYLVDMFERHWERARPFTNRETSMMKDIAAEQRAMTIRMLIEGHADPTSAKRLGVSPRTYAGYISDLKEEYEAQTRFQLGYAMGSQGVSGQEHVPDPE